MPRRFLATLLVLAALSAAACASEQVRAGTDIDPAAQKTVAAHVFNAMDVQPGQEFGAVLDRMNEVVSTSDNWMVIERSNMIVDGDGYSQKWFIFNDGSAMRFFGSAKDATGKVRFVGIEVTPEAR